MRPIAGRPVRALLSALGVAIGVAAFVLLAGMQGMNDAAVVRRLDSAYANQVSVTVDTARLPSTLAVPADLADAAASVGVAQPVVSWRLENAVVTRLLPDGTQAVRTWPVVAATRQIAARTDIRARHSFAPMLSSPGTAMVGVGLARTENLRPGDALDIDGHHVVVTDIIDDAVTRPDLLLSIVVSDATAVTVSQRPYSVVVSGFTPPAGASTYAALLPRILAPGHEDLVRADAVSDTRDSVAAIAADVLSGTRYIGLCAALLGALMVGITQYSAVIERLGEYSLKKSLGARGSQLFVELFVRSGVVGLLGGVLGLVTGVLALAALSLALGEPAFLAPWVPVAALVGAGAVGGLGGAAAGARAARVDPIAFIRT